MSVNNQTSQDRVTRRRERIASIWKHDDRYERMRALQEADPARFDEIYGARGALQLGLYVSGKEAADDDTDGPAAA